MPAIRLFRPLAEKGNAKAQSLLGVMYRRGQGVARSSAHAFIWFSRAAAHGDARAKVGTARGVADHDAAGNFGRRRRWRRPARRRTTGIANIRGLSPDVSNIAPTSASSIKNKTFREASVRINRLPADCEPSRSGFECRSAGRIAGGRAEERRHAAALSQRQSAQHLAARGIDDRRR